MLVQERFNGEINVHVNLPLKVCFRYMEDFMGVLNTNNPVHLGACQALGHAVLTVACDDLVADHDVSTVRRARGAAVGRPCELRTSGAHPTGLRAVPPGADFVTRYENTMARPLRREPLWVARRDPLHGNLPRQAARDAAVAAMWGSPREAWYDLVNHMGRNLFIPTWRMYVSFR